MQRKKEYKPRSARVTNEFIANALPVNEWLTKTQISELTNIKIETLPPRLKTLTDNSYLSRRNAGTKRDQWKMNENQKRWLIQSTKNGDVETGKRGQKKGKPGRIPVRKAPENKFNKGWEFLSSVGFV